MRNPENPATNQMTLSNKDEWFGAGTVWSGKEVFVATKRRSAEWLSDCERERSLTQDLMTRIADLSNLAAACRHVMAKGGRPGVDGMSVKELGMWFSSNWQSLQSDLLSMSYRPLPVLGVRIPKPGGGERQLGIPTVKDRLVQQAIHQVLSPRYERVFSVSSYGFRRGRSAHDAVLRVGEYVREGFGYVVDVDLAKFFDEVNHDRLLWLLGHRIGDKRVLSLMGRFLRSGLLSEGLSSQRIKGTPQGGPLSPLLSNIVLDELDKELERRGHRFVRYADDIVIMVRSSVAGERVLGGVRKYLENRLRLRVNAVKSAVRHAGQTCYLGYRLFSNGSLGLSVESESRFKDKVRSVTRRNRGVSFGQVLLELNRVLRGWLNYFYLARMRKKLIGLMGWIRRKLRCYRLKQCKRAIGIARFLMRRGVAANRSWATAATRRDWWRQSGTPGATEAMNLAWFTRIGLVDLVSIYNDKHSKKPPYTRVRTVV